jgi:hypothetical protein
MLANQIETTRFPADKRLIDELLKDKEVAERLGAVDLCREKGLTRVQLLATAARIDHLLSTLDPDELRHSAWCVAMAADSYEEKHGGDVF